MWLTTFLPAGRNAEQVVELRAAFDGDADDAGVGNESEVVKIAETLVERAAEGAGEVVAAFGPVEAAAGEFFSSGFFVGVRGDGREFYGEGFFEEFTALGSDGEGLGVGFLEEIAFEEALGDANAEPAGEVAVAGAGALDGAVLWSCCGGVFTCVRVSALGARGQDQQSFDGVGDFCAGEAVVAVAALAFDAEEAALDELGEMFAGGLRGDIGGGGEFASGKGVAAHKTQQNGGAAGIAKQLCGGGESLVHGDIVALKILGYYGPRRSFSVIGNLDCGVRDAI